MILVVADTGPIHYLILIDAVQVLPQLFDRLILPAAVFNELTHPRAPESVRHWADNLPDWVDVKRPIRNRTFGRLEPGKSEAISLALALNPASLLLDEAEARAEALRHGLPVSGDPWYPRKSGPTRDPGYVVDS